MSLQINLKCFNNEKRDLEFNAIEDGTYYIAIEIGKVVETNDIDFLTVLETTFNNDTNELTIKGTIKGSEGSITIKPDNNWYRYIN